jgi:hypothetical protein
LRSEASEYPIDGDLGRPSRRGVSVALRSLPVSLLTDLDAFSLEHRYGGDLDGGVDGDIVRMACDCGAIGPPS